MPDAARSGLYRGRAFERMLTFTDGVVAVAVTILALPIIDIAEPSATESMWQVLGNNIGSIAALVFTFGVVTVMWLAHNRIVNVADAFDGGLLWLNIVWLVGIILLPWPSRLLGDTLNPGDYAGQNLRDNADIALFYWLLLALISFVGTIMNWHILRHRDLWGPDGPQRVAELNSGPAKYRGLSMSVACLAIGVVWFLNPNLGQWLPVLLLVPLSLILRPRRRAKTASDSGR